MDPTVGMRLNLWVLHKVSAVYMYKDLWDFYK